jgi:hypothetical protein
LQIKNFESFCAFIRFSFAWFLLKNRKINLRLIDLAQLNKRFDLTAFTAYPFINRHFLLGFLWC